MEIAKEKKFVSIIEYMPLPEEPDQYSSAFIELHSVIILVNEKESVTVGVSSPEDTDLRDLLSHFHDKPVFYRNIDHYDLLEYLGKKHGKLVGESKSSTLFGRERLYLDRIANDAPVINFVNSTIIEGIRKRASDIHIEAFANSAKVRYRIDGALKNVNNISSSMFPAVSSRIKIMSNLNIMERRLPQDGRTSVHLGSDSQDIRVSIVPTAPGESIVLRILNRKGSLLGLHELGFEKQSLFDIRKMLKTPFGLILVSGPTGSGKTTTLNSMLREMDSESQKIITLEDPIEYVMDNIDQIEINETIGLTFCTILKRVLRQDPDVIMIGEIRDSETAGLAMRAALTGHLVLATLHTNDSVSVIDRLRDMEVDSFMIAAVLKSSIAQRLVRRLCPECRKKRKITFSEKLHLKNLCECPDTLYESDGCDLCDGTGYYGRILINEYFSKDNEIERLIASGSGRSEIKKYLKSKHMVDLFGDGLQKVVLGSTTLTELEKVLADQ